MIRRSPVGGAKRLKANRERGRSHGGFHSPGRPTSAIHNATDGPRHLVVAAPTDAKVSSIPSFNGFVFALLVSSHPYIASIFASARPENPAKNDSARKRCVHDWHSACAASLRGVRARSLHTFKSGVY